MMQPKSVCPSLSAGLVTLAALLTLPALLVFPALAQGPSLVNFETPHVHPLAMTPDGSKLLAVNTPDNRLEVFTIGVGIVAHSASIPVGLDPVSVRARTNSEAWVVNNVSDSVSIVDLTTLNVTATLPTADEPRDVVFAGSPQKAFVSCSQHNRILIFDPQNPGSPSGKIDLKGEDPRAMAVSDDGMKIYVAIFESGNGTTILTGGNTALGAKNPVDSPLSPHATGSPPVAPNPPPNVPGGGFDPPLNPALPNPPAKGLIVRRSAAGGGVSWLDDTAADWTPLVSGPNASESGRIVGWDMPDNDVAIIDANAETVSYVSGLMNHNMALTFLSPFGGPLTLVGTDATNEIRFLPNLNGTFVRVKVAHVFFNAAGQTSVVSHDLNPHLSYTVPTVSQSLRDRSIGDPRGIVWDPTKRMYYVIGMGSNNLAGVVQNGGRFGNPSAPGTVELGEGPTGIVMDDPRRQLYVLNKFDSSITVLDASGFGLPAVLGHISFYDPSPDVIKDGRKFLYDTHETSGLGHVSCAACHTDARKDRLAWDLGNPAGEMQVTNGLPNENIGKLTPGGGGDFPDFHPMKGPMLTQTLQDILGKEPFYWRGSQRSIESFNGAFTDLLGDDQQLTMAEMSQLKDFLATIHFPPNPYRTIDNGLSTNVSLEDFTDPTDPDASLPPGNALQGGIFFFAKDANLETGVPPTSHPCVACHCCQAGKTTSYIFRAENQIDPAGWVSIPVGPNGENHSFMFPKSLLNAAPILAPQLRDLYDRRGFDLNSTESLAGFDATHDGTVPLAFLAQVFTSSTEELADLLAFLLSYSGSGFGNVRQFFPNFPVNFYPPMDDNSLDAHAGVGEQVTLASGTNPPSVLDKLTALADGGAIGVVVKGRQVGLQRGYKYLGNGLYQSDRLTEIVSHVQLLQGAALGHELTFTAVPLGSEERIGIDRDEDGLFDRDELDAGRNPADPNG